MVISILILVVSTALCLFYLQTSCERALRHEFSRPYFSEIVNVLQLQYPSVRVFYHSNGKGDYSQNRFILKCDFVMLEYLLKNSDSESSPLSRYEKILIYYFHFLFYSLPLRRAFHLHEKKAILKLTTILQFFANSLGEKLSYAALSAAYSGEKSQTSPHLSRVPFL